MRWRDMADVTHGVDACEENPDALSSILDHVILVRVTVTF